MQTAARDRIDTRTSARTASLLKMEYTMAWIILFLAGILEIGWAIA